MNSIRKSIVILATVFALQSCIGTDVIEEISVPEVLQITSSISSIKVGESMSFGASYFNQKGELEDVFILWASSDPSVISIDSEGLATAHKAGKVIISATYISAEQGELTDSVEVEAGDVTTVVVARETSFQGRNSYRVSGDGLLIDNEGVLTVELQENFTATVGPGLHVYLSNSATNVSGGIDLGAIKSHNGFQTYSVPDNIELNTYNIIVIYCQPFSVTFGFGELN